MNQYSLAAPFYRSARLHFSFARLFQRTGDTTYSALSTQWGNEDRRKAQQVLREERLIHAQ